MGSNTNPQSVVPFVPANDKLINHYSRAYKLNFFTEDPAFPSQPAGIQFKAPVVNMGPDADFYRDPISGTVKKASAEGTYLQTFTAHRSPLGLAFDNGSLPAPFTGLGFMLSWSQGADSAGLIYGSDTSIGPFVDPSEDLLMLMPTNQNSFDTIQCSALITAFHNPIDFEIVGNYMYVIENRASDARLFQFVVGEPSGLKVLEPRLDVVVSPNPATNYVKLQLPPALLQQKIDIKIVSMLGECVHTSVYTAASETFTLSIESFSPGLYTIILSTPTQSSTSNFVLTH